MPSRLFACFGLLTLLASACPAPCRAHDFHIESSVYSGKEAKPVSQNTTIFRAGVVYDYLSDKTVAVFDKPRNRFLLLDPSRRMKTEVRAEELERFCDELRERAAKEKSAYVKFVANPRFQVSFDDAASELTLKSGHMTYRVSTAKAESDDAAQQYREFSDWYARLNAMTNHTPPFARMVLNEELQSRGLVATQVQLTIPQQVMNLGQGITLRSEHHVEWKLLKLDLDMITKTQNQLATFKPVSLEKFQQVSVAQKK